MRLIFTFIFLLFTSFSYSQKLTGIWRGYFVQKGFDFGQGGTVGGDKYKFEIQINLLPNKAIEGVTYSYRNTAFYGKAAMQGVFITKTNYVVIKELKMLELKIEDMSDPCLMTCNLDYAKNGKKEVLSGDFTSLNIKTKRDCGDGYVYLEKVPESDFKKEDFLLKRKTEGNETAKPKTGKLKPGAETDLVRKDNKVNTTPKPTTVPKKIDPKKSTTSTTNKKDLSKTNGKNKPEIKDNNTVVKSTPTKKDSGTIVKVITEPIKPKVKATTKPLPASVANRTNNLVKTYYVDEGEVKIELYDNGQIDNDSVSVYHNGEPVILHGRLSIIPLTTKFKVNADNPYHELIMVADNLGEIPPNTSLMIVTAGKSTYQVFLTSDLDKNAKVNFEYRPEANTGVEKK